MSSFQRIGNEQQVNVFTDGSQSTQPEVFGRRRFPKKTIAIDSTGNVVIAWTSEEQDGSKLGTYVRRYQYDEATNRMIPRGSDDELVNLTTEDNQAAPVVAVDNSGDYVVVWSGKQPAQDDWGEGIYARLFNADGTAVSGQAGGEVLVNTQKDEEQFSPSVARINAKNDSGQEVSGDYVVTWTSAGQDGSQNGIFFQEFNADGTKKGGERGIDSTVGEQTDSAVAINAQGDFVIVWEDNRGGSNFDIYAQVFYHDGSKSAVLPVNTKTADGQSSPSVAMDQVGNFIVVWASQPQSGNSGVYARRFQRDGTAIDSQDVAIQADTNSTLEPFPSVAVNPAKGDLVTDQTGDIIIVWSEPDAFGQGVYAKRYGMNNLTVPIDDKFLVNQSENNDQLNPSVAMNGDGNFAVSWSRRSNLNEEVVFQAFRIPDNPPPVITTTTSDLTYTEKAAPVTIDAGVTITDDSGNLQRVIVQIENYRQAQDFLIAPASLPSSIATPVFDPGVGTLTIPAKAASAPASDFQTVVRAITYRSEANPNGGTRKLTFSATDAAGTTGTSSRNLVLTLVNDAPTITIPEGTTPLLIDENAKAIVADTISLSDLDNPNLVSARVEIVNFNATTNQGDRLLFTDQNGISGSYANGVLTLTGSTSLANYQLALQSIEFQTDGAGGDRTLRFTVNDGGSTNNNASADRLVRVTAINDAPEVRFTETSTLTYREKEAPLSLGGTTITVTDEENDPITSIVISIENLDANDRIDYTIPPGSGIVATLDRTAGTLTLNGTAEPALYQTLLRSLSFSNNSDNPGAATRTFRIGARANALESLTPAIRVINVINVASPPSLAPATDSFSANERTITPIAEQINLIDADSPTLKGAVIQFTGNSFVAGQDALRFNNQNGISGSFDATQGILTLTGNASVQDYQDALRSITYYNSSREPNPNNRALSIRVTDNTDLSSNVATRSFTVLNTPDPPEITPGEDTVTYIENEPAIVIAPNLTTLDQDSGEWFQAIVTITNVRDTGDANQPPIEELVIRGNLPNGITASNFDPATNSLTLTGRAPFADYQAALRSIAYINRSENPTGTNRTIRFQATDTADLTRFGRADRQIQIQSQNDLPQITVNSVELNYADNSGSLILDNILSIRDTDDTQLKGAVVRIDEGFQDPEDTLDFTVTLPAEITVVGRGTGTLTLTGVASITQYQTILQSVFYRNTNTNLQSGKRVILFTVVDAKEGVSQADQRVIQVRNNNEPIVVLNDAPLAYTEKQAPIRVDTDLEITDLDNLDQLERAVVYIDGATDTNDILNFDPAALPGNITLKQQLNNRLTFEGQASREDYRGLLRSITYQNDNPQQATRDIVIEVFDGIETSPREARRINVTANAAPVLSLSDTAIDYIEGRTVNLAEGMTITDADVGDLIDSATVTLDGFISNEDTIAFTATLPSSIQTEGFNPDSHSITFTGSASTAEYETVLRSLTYRNRSNDPTPTSRTLRISVSDGTETSNLVSRTITIATNTPPIVSMIDPVLSYTEGQGSVILDGNLTITDSDSALLESATVLVRGYVANQDTIGFTQSLVPATVTPVTTTTPEGHLSIAFTGRAPLGDYLALLRSITYSNNSSNPETTPRTIEVQVSDGIETGTDSRIIQVEIKETVPILDPSDTVLRYRESSGAQIIDDAITISDEDSTSLVSAIVRIDPSTFADGQDILEFNNQNELGIRGTYDAVRGILNLTGNASIANYQTALRSITFRNDSADPRTGDRRIIFTANDGQGSSREEHRLIQIEIINTRPVVTPSLEDITYREDDPAVLVDGNIGVSDPDSPNLSGAKVKITNVQAGDVLTFSAQGGITGGYSATAGELTLTGNARREDYEAVLRSIRFRNTSQNPNPTPRELEFSVTDTNNASNDGTATRKRLINVTPINDAPTLRLNRTSQTYTDNAGAVRLNTGIVVEDADSATLTGAIVSLEGFISGEDSLSFTNANDISGSFANGILTLTGTASIANYQTALQSITYTNLSPNPTLRDRTIRFTVSDGTDSSTPSERFTLQIADADTPPILTLATTALAYSEGAGALSIDSTLRVVDGDSQTLTRATIAIQNYIPGEESLSFTNQSGITGSFNPTTGVLTLTGNASVANYEAGLRSVTYTNRSANPSNTARTIQFTVQDAVNTSVPQTRAIQITPINSLPFLATTNLPLAYREKSGVVAIDPSLLIVDADSPTLSGATVTVSGFIPQQDLLSFTPRAGITGNFDPTTATLNLTGNASIADYQAVLQSVSYVNSSNQPETTNRTVQFTVRDNANGTSNTATRIIQVISINDAPVVTASVKSVPFILSTGAVTLDPQFTVRDLDSLTLTGATIKLGLYIPGQDNLIFSDRAGITGTLDGANGELTLTGTATVADYQTALRSIVYLNNSNTPDLRSRSVSIQVTDGITPSNTAQFQIEFSQSTGLPILDLNGVGAGTDFSNTFTITGPAVPVISPEARLLNNTNSILVSAQISISNPFDVGEEELLVNLSGTDLIASFNPSRTALKLSGRATTDTYLQVLRSLRYINHSENPDRTTRVILFTVNDGDRGSEVTQTTMQISPINVQNPPPDRLLETGNSLETTPGTDILNCGSSNDTVTSTLANLQQNDRINGEAGMDTFKLTDGTGNATVKIDTTSNQLQGIVSGTTTITGFESFDFTGFSGNVSITGSTRADDRLTGGAGNDTLEGQAGSDRLVGNGGNDTLNGGLGNDTMIGGLGDDTYLVDSAGDVVTEADNAGFDVVVSLLAGYILPKNFEDLRLEGGALAAMGNMAGNRIKANSLNNSIDGGLGNDFLMGEAGNDQLIGGEGNDELRGGVNHDQLLGEDGNDRLYGDGGRDTLTGGKGQDGFYFTTPRHGVDRITDFNSKDDTILISRAGFNRTLKLGRIRSNQFVLGSRAQDSSDRFLYSQSTGALFYDPDGHSGANPIQLAQLSNRAALTRSDIVIVR